MDTKIVLDRQAARDKIKAGDSDEKLVPASPCPHWIVWPAYYQNKIRGALPEVWVRQSVYDRLLQVANDLAPDYKLVLLDGWRPQEVQESLFFSIKAVLAKENPELSNEEVEELTQNYASKATDDRQQPSPHLTGGSVDVTLADCHGRFLDMGGDFDDPHEKSWSDYPIGGIAQENRKILYDAMIKAGFTNLPSEWWHFDYGNWLWAWYKKEEKALYGPATL